MGMDRKILLFAKPIAYPEKYNISITAEGENIEYSIFNFETNSSESINSEFIHNGNLNFNADTTYFKETYVDKNFIDIKLESPSPIKLEKIQIQPVQE